MADVRPSHYIIGIVIFTLFIVGGVSMLSIFRSADPAYGDDGEFQQFNDTFNVLDDITEEVGNLEDNIANADTDFGAFGVLNSLISSAWQTLKLLFSSFGFMTSVFGGLTMFGIPAWIPGLIVLLITVMLAFAIYSAIFQRDI